jgi:DNA-3-methyladenine glycosylase
MRLALEFFQRSKVTQIARELLGKVLITRTDGKITAGLIVESEAYSWRERGCHAFNNKRTSRNEVMFGPGGFAYVYLCYGIHHLFNVVTNAEDRAEAVLIRALEPLQGTELMRERMQVDRINGITSGPGKLTRALGIDRSFNGKFLLGEDIWIEEGTMIKPREIVSSRRIGIDYAGKDALLPWRFSLRGNVWVSRTAT